MKENNQLPPLEIPMNALSESALAGMIDAFIMREGTDYGVHEITHETKVKQIIKQLENGTVKIVFDPNTETATLITEVEYKKLSKSFHR